MKWLARIDRFLAAVEKAAIMLLLAALAFFITINVVLRNLFEFSFQQIPEFSPVLVMWLALMGASLAVRKNRHIRIALLLRFVPDGFAGAAKKITAGFGLAVMGFLFYASLLFVMNEAAIFGPRGLLSVIFPWFFFTAGFRFFIQICRKDPVVLPTPPEKGPP